MDLNSFAGIEIVTQPSVGELTFDGAIFSDGETISLADLTLNKLVYTPQTDDEAGSSFTFKVMDDTGAYSDLAYTLTLDIDRRDDAPSATNTSISVDEDVPHPFAVSDFDFTDPDGNVFDGIIFKGFTGTGDLRLNGNPLNLDDPVSASQIVAGQLTFTTALDDTSSGNAMDYLVVDDTGESSVSAATLSLNVTAQNDPPTGVNNQITVVEDGSYDFDSVDFGFADVDGHQFATLRIDSLPANGSLKLGENALTVPTEILFNEISQLVYEPTDDDVTDGVFNFTLEDSSGEESLVSYEMRMKITETDDIPTSQDETVTILEDSTKQFAETDFTFNDVDLNDTFAAVIIVDMPLRGSLTLNAQTFSSNTEIPVSDLTDLVYTPELHDTNGANFTFKVKDSAGTPSTVIYTYTLAITPDSDLPTALDSDVNTLEDQSYQFASNDFNFSDVDGDSLKSVTLKSGVGLGDLEINGVRVQGGETVDVADINTITYTPENNDVVGSSFTFSVTDSTDDESLLDYVMTIVITPEPDAPTVSVTSINVTEDQNHVFNGTDFGFADVDGDSFKTLNFVAARGNGRFSLNGSPVTTATAIDNINISQFVYQPDLHDELGGDFDFYVTDSTDRDSVQYTMTLNILTDNDAPEASDITRQVDEDVTYNFSPSTFLSPMSISVMHYLPSLFTARRGQGY